MPQRPLGGFYSEALLGGPGSARQLHWAALSSITVRGSCPRVCFEGRALARDARAFPRGYRGPPARGAGPGPCPWSGAVGGAGGRGRGGSSGLGDGGRAAALRGCGSGTGPHRPAQPCARPADRRMGTARAADRPWPAAAPRRGRWWRGRNKP